MDNKELRQFALALLNDDQGINENAWDILRGLLEKSGENKDLIAAVDATEGRFYVPEWHE